MILEQVTAHVYSVLSGDANIYIIVQPEGLILVDAGFSGVMELLDESIRSLGRDPREITDVLVTHCHPDHAGGAAEIAAATGARVWMHPADATLARRGQGFRPFEVSPGEENQAFVNEVILPGPQIYLPAPVDKEVSPGEEIPVAGGILAIGTPGHTEGHLVFLWNGDGGTLFLGDAAKNVDELGPSPIYENFAQGMGSLRQLGTYSFAVACFGHGEAIVGEAASILKKRWS